MTEEVDIDDKLNKINKELNKICKKESELAYNKKRLLQAKEALKNLKYQNKNAILSNKDWTTELFTWSDDVRNALKKSFHLNEFRPQQLETINAVLSKHDVLLLAPTGGGKSLCYQLPAVILPGITVVISPLVSLMDDQVWSIRKLGINAQSLCSTTEKGVSQTIYKQLMDVGAASMKILYVTPERLSKSKKFMNALQKCYQNKRLDQIAIDEIHCISSWGHDFRPDYKYLNVLKTLFPDVPLLGFTATATTKVIADVQKILNLKECVVFKATFNRPNLYYHVLEKPSEKDATYDLIADLLKSRFREMSGIIYTFSIKDTMELTTGLLERDIKVRPYHSNLDNEKRAKIHQKWLSGEIQAVVATVAFGMGIDKPDVRFVIHHTISKSIENFYQETGRAGRDGKRADCILLYRFADIFRITSTVISESKGLKNTYSMIEYCTDGKRCRRNIISKHFSEVWDDNHCDKMCDRCYFKDKVLSPLLDVTDYYKTLKKIIENAEKMQVKLTGAKLIDAWFHKGPVKNRIGIPPPILDRYIGEQIVGFLLINEYFKEDFQFTPFSTNSYINVGNICPSKSGIKYQPGRVYNLPSKFEKNKYNSDEPTTSTVRINDQGKKHKDKSDTYKEDEIKPIRINSLSTKFEKKRHNSDEPNSTVCINDQGKKRIDKIETDEEEERETRRFISSLISKRDKKKCNRDQSISTTTSSTNGQSKKRKDISDTDKTDEEKKCKWSMNDSIDIKESDDSMKDYSENDDSDDDVVEVSRESQVIDLSILSD